MNPKLLAALLCLFLACTPPCHAGLWSWLRGKKPDEKIKEQSSEIFNKNKQSLFNSFHPVGTALEVKVHEVQIAWKNDIPSKDLKNMLGFGIVFTIYWRGPITTDGYTKVYAVYDAQVQRYVGSRVLATNGITNQQATEYAIDFFNGYLNGN
ncbi:MAG: hypothetical protein B9S32_07315 [Verrucomicrobia bacterium Tous-C9LFEB]|nr:MAG: hypothetical protein B9S32_07315 [Verrucomicrobia bacterium Tous-C9LFEB]